MNNKKFKNIDKIFSISSQEEFESMAIEIFKFQHSQNTVYRQYCDYLNIEREKVLKLKQIPFLPISFFKTHNDKKMDPVIFVILCNTEISKISN